MVKLDKNPRISISEREGNKEKTVEVISAIEGIKTMSEVDARIKIQEAIDAHGLRPTIIYGGNRVWSRKRLIRDLMRIIRSDDMGKLTDYLYDFFNLVCGSIAHYGKSGWIGVYPTVSKLREFFLKNEFGCPVLRHIPVWHSDARLAAGEMVRMLELDKMKKFRVVWSIYLEKVVVAKDEDEAGIEVENGAVNDGDYVSNTFEHQLTEEVKSG